MLFNTLTYAKFFAVVFLIVWLLVRRRLALWVPWIAVSATALFDIFALETARARGFDAVVVLLAGAFTWQLSRLDARDLSSRQADDPRPRPRFALASSVINFAALGWILWHHQRGHLLSATLEGLGIPAGALHPTGKTSEILWSVGSVALVAIVGAFVLRARRVRLLFILGASYVFYAHWDYRFVALIFASSTVDYWLGLRIGNCEDPVRRKRWLWLTVFVNLGVLSIFKYLNFGIATALEVLGAAGFQPPSIAVQVALPVGISFFTFESMSYVIDVYRRDLPPHRSYLEYLSFVAFFPHLVAGPIIRPRDLLPQLAARGRFDSREGSEGLFLIAWGLLKKVAIGDYLALNLVDRVFDAPTQYSALECYTAVVSYAVQIYCDFSGYTDVAIGSALLLGIRFPLNFDAPYKAHNIQDFWRRWHISLSTWLRDYLYIPLGGNRKGTARTYVNLMLTMLLGGLWHGASWNFVIWGGLHGVALAVHRALGRKHQQPPSFAARALGVFLTFHFVCAAWIFFRAESLSHVQVMFGQLLQLSTFHPNLHAKVLLVLAVGLATHFAPEQWFQRTQCAFIELPSLAQGFALLLAALVLREMISAEAVPFVYFQF